MTREELIALGRKITGDEETDRLMELFDRHVPHPQGSSLFFYPENYDARRDDLSAYKPSVEEIVDLCLAYRPICL
ncbi:TPA: bacteriocin immunity protein [Neisseria bacilliformis]|uniref:bacteriocin immunity protein n=1 Tax=Neisseria bacilliformis TaxID=267212 RepID=UPI0006679DCF|nr:bacteriocin immunity protein [Neisseria bacilliformis]